MAIAVSQDLILDFLTEAQKRQYVPYSLVIDGLTLNSLFDQGQFARIGFILSDSLRSKLLTIVYLRMDEKLLTDYDPFLLSELDDETLFALYHIPAFGLKSSEPAMDAAKGLPSVSFSFRDGSYIAQILLEKTMPDPDMDAIMMENSVAELSLCAPIRYYDPYLLTDFDPYTLNEMYDISLLKGGL